MTKTITTDERGAQPPGEAAGARERLLDAAEALIYAGGIHATGVDAIVRESGTARKSFYTHFASKDELIACALRRRDERWMAWFVDATRQRRKRARTRLLGMFDVLREWFVAPGFHGCAFLNAAGEIASPDDPIRQVSRLHKEKLFAFVRDECDAFCAEAKLDARRATHLARAWLILIDGAIGVALVSGDSDAALNARHAGERLLRAEMVDSSEANPKASESKTRTGNESPIASVSRKRRAS